METNQNNKNPIGKDRAERPFDATREIRSPFSAEESQALEDMLDAKKNRPQKTEETKSNGISGQAVRPRPARTPAQSHAPKSTAQKPDTPELQKIRAERYAENKDAYYSGDEEDDSALSNVLKSIIYIVSVLLVSITLSYFVIVLANDVFAFVKDDNAFEMTVQENMSVSDIADILGEQGIIKYPAVFRIYHSFRGYSENFKPGTYSVSGTMGYDSLIATLLGRRTDRETIILTFYEGQTVDEIIDKFVENGIGTREGFIDVIQNYPYEYKFLETMKENPSRKYRLEGYLFPDTYYFYADSNEATAIYKMLENFDSKINDKYYARAEELGLCMDEIVTVASIVQWEAGRTAEFEYVSSVIHNRLRSADFSKIECDATVIYAIGGERKDTVTPEDTEFDDPYNTYLYDGLPPGAIGNPGLDSIEAALYPATSNYYYFVADNNGKTIFSSTLREHEAAIAKIRAERG